MSDKDKPKTGLEDVLEGSAQAMWDLRPEWLKRKFTDPMCGPKSILEAAVEKRGSAE